jgi:hypothetical protein
MMRVFRLRVADVRALNKKRLFGILSQQRHLPQTFPSLSPQAEYDSSNLWVCISERACVPK